MEIKTTARLLSAESKPYDFGGNQGVSHKIRLNIEGEIYVCKSNANQVASLLSEVGSEGVALVKINSRAEKMSLELVSFE